MVTKITVLFSWSQFLKIKGSWMALGFLPEQLGQHSSHNFLRGIYFHNEKLEEVQVFRDRSCGDGRVLVLRWLLLLLGSI